MHHQSFSEVPLAYVRKHHSDTHKSACTTILPSISWLLKRRALYIRQRIWRAVNQTGFLGIMIKTLQNLWIYMAQPIINNYIYGQGSTENV